jgi:hypothetical protein
MRTRQDRRSVSLRPQVYRRLKELAELRGVSGSSIIEQWITVAADRVGVPTYTRDECRPPKREEEDLVSEEIVSQHFTW